MLISKRRFVLAGVALCAALNGGLVQAQEWPAVFDPLQLLTLNVQMDPTDWVTVRHDTTYELEKQALFWADGEDPLFVSVRRKSAFALPSEEDPQKVSLKIDINEYVTGQKWHGLTKLSLENGDDVDVVAEGLAWNLHRWASGPEGYGYAYPAGMANWARVYVNGEYIGLYLSVEQRNKQLLRNRGLYIKNESWLYKLHDVGDFELAIAMDVGANPNSPTLEALCFLPFASEKSGSPHYLPGGPCPAPDPAALEVVLPANINMQAMLTMAAVNAFIANPDSLFSHAGNAFCADFLDGTPRMYFPWDLDGIHSSTSYNIYTMTKGKKKTDPTMYQEMILAHPTFRAQYNQIMTDLLDGPFAEADIHAFLDAVEPVISPSLEEDPNNNIDETVAGYFDSIGQWISERTPNVRQQIFKDQPPVCTNGVCEWGEDVCACPQDCGLPDAGEVVGLTCDDGVDNDCDDDVDCNDLDCAADPHCQTPGCDHDGVCEPGEDCSTCPSDCEGKLKGKPADRFCCGDGEAQPPEGDGSICDGHY